MQGKALAKKGMTQAWQGKALAWQDQTRHWVGKDRHGTGLARQGKAKVGIDTICKQVCVATFVKVTLCRNTIYTFSVLDTWAQCGLLCLFIKCVLC